MNDKLITLDANILVYAIDIDAGKRHQQAIEIIEQVRFFDCVLTLQALSEFFAVAIRKQKMPIEEAIAQINDWQEIFPTVSATPSSLSKAALAVQNHNLSFWDAMLWAAAHDANVTLLLSEDFQNGRILEGVKFLNPFLLENITDIFEQA
ncbi:MAG: PIN domain-containing protein [Pseudomonadota bacterium]